MPDLPPVTQEFIADTTRYVTAMETAIAAAKRLVDANNKAIASVAALSAAIKDLPDVKRIQIIVDTVGAPGAGGELPGIIPGVGAANAAIRAALAALKGEAEAAAGPVADVAGAMAEEGDAAAAAAAKTGGFWSALREGATAAAGAAMAVGAASLAVMEMGGAAGDARVHLAGMVGAGAAAAAAAAAVGVSALGAAAGAARAGGGFANAVKGVVQWQQAAKAAAGAGLAWIAVGSIFTKNMASMVHWITMGSFELAAVLVPALIALGSAVMVALPGIVSVYRHMTSLYNATEATYNVTNKSMGSFLGLGNALQKAQNAAQPAVYAALGAAINAASHQTGFLVTAGAALVRMFDEFAARTVVDMRTSSGQIRSLLSQMVSDLAMFGQIIANVGHAILNFASAAPGLAHVLLGIVDAASKVILWISRLPAWLITTVFVLEEFYRWGGLVAAVLMAIARTIPALMPLMAGGVINLFKTAGAVMSGIVSIGAAVVYTFGSMVRSIGTFIPMFARAGGAIAGFGNNLDRLAQNQALMTWVSAAVIALGLLIYWIVSTRTATEQWISASQRLVSQATGINALNVISGQLAQTSMRLTQAQHQLVTAVDQTNGATAGLLGTFTSFQGASVGAANSVGLMGTHVSATSPAIMKLSSMLGGLATDLHLSASEADFVAGIMGSGFLSSIINAGIAVGELRDYEKQLIMTGTTVALNLGFLAARFHTSTAGAAAMAGAVGVNLQVPLYNSSLAAKIAYQNISDLERGLGLMSGPTSIVGADMNYMGVQTALAGTKVQQLNQAFDQFLATVTGGMSALSGLQAQIGQMKNGFVGAANSITGSSTNISFSLKGVGNVAMQSWGQFTQAVTQAGSVLDNLRTGMAEGVVSERQYTLMTRAVVAEMLRFTGGNKAAVSMLSVLAHSAGGPTTTSLKTLAHWAGMTGRQARSVLSNGMQHAAIEMGNLSKVAKNLSVTIGQQLDATMAATILKVTKVDSAEQNYIKVLANGKSTASQRAQAQDALSTALGNAWSVMQRVTQSNKNLWSATDTTSGALRTTAGVMHMAAQKAYYLAQMIDNIHSRSVTVTTYFNRVYTTSGAPGGTPRKGAHGGVLGGYAPGHDSVPMLLSPGEAVLNPYAVRMLGTETIHALNQFSESNLVRPYVTPPHSASIAAAGGGDLVIQVDGRELLRVLSAQGYKYNVRNSGRVTGLLSPT